LDIRRFLAVRSFRDLGKDSRGLIVTRLEEFKRLIEEGEKRL